jgi:sugar/nucleoside kinase (ribokinase family)
MTSTWDVLALGSIAVDDLIYVDQFPTEDKKKMIQSRRQEAGGQAATALVAAARLGASAAYFGVLGRDDLSRFVIGRLETEGVDCTAIIRRDEARPIHSVVIVVPAAHTRTILFTEAGFSGPLDEEITEEVITNCKVLQVDQTVVSAGIKAVEIAKSHNIPVVADFESDRDPRVYELVPQVDHLVISEEFGRKITAEQDEIQIVQALADPHRPACVVTAGSKGAWYSEFGGEVRHCPAMEVQVVDTTGCGDVFHGAYTACLARGVGIPQAVQVATVTAGITATRPGGQRGIPVMAEVNKHLNLGN